MFGGQHSSRPDGPTCLAIDDEGQHYSCVQTSNAWPAEDHTASLDAWEHIENQPGTQPEGFAIENFLNEFPDSTDSDVHGSAGSFSYWGSAQGNSNSVSSAPEIEPWNIYTPANHRDLLTIDYGLPLSNKYFDDSMGGHESLSSIIVPARLDSFVSFADEVSHNYHG